jgi:hypothetical protein
MLCVNNAISMGPYQDMRLLRSQIAGDNFLLPVLGYETCGILAKLLTDLPPTPAIVWRDRKT